MPAPTTRRLASTALCATLLLGITGPAAMAADHGASPDVLKAALTADNRRLPADEAAGLGQAAKDAIARIKTPTPAAIAPTPAPTGPIPVPTGPIPSRNEAQSDALAALRKAVDDLAAAATSGNAGQVLPAATAVLNKLISVLIASVTGGMTMPTLPSLTGLPPSSASKPTPTLTPKPTVTAAPSLPKR